MVRYFIKRICYAVLTLTVLLTLTFFLMQMLPGEPFTGEKAITPAVEQALKAKYGLDKPVIVQFGMYVSNVLKGDLGESIHYSRPVVNIIKESFPYSFDLGMRALIFAVVFGVLLGITAARKRGTWGDSVTMLFAVIGVSVPSFIVAALLQYFLSLKLNQWIWVNIDPNFSLFPVTGYDTVLHTILPTIALGFSSMATISRLMRTSMLDVLGQDYIKTAKAKGLSQRTTVWKHAVRNALMPIITVLGPISASVLTGAFVVENIFSIPGMGKFFVLGIQVQDYFIITGTTLFYGAFLIIANLIVDLLYGVVDPRVKLDS